MTKRTYSCALPMASLLRARPEMSRLRWSKRESPSIVCEVFGTRGAYMIEDNALWQSRVGDGEWKRVEIDPGDLAPGMRDNDWSRGFTNFSRRIVEALQEGRTSVEGAATFEDGYQTQLVLDAARASHESGCWEGSNRLR